MGLLEPEPALTDLRRARLEVRRTVDRLRSMPIARLKRPIAASGAAEPHAIVDPAADTPAARTFALASTLADEAADREGRQRQPLPTLPATSAGDVLAVCANDLIALLAGTADPVATARLSEAMIELRRSL